MRDGQSSAVHEPDYIRRPSTSTVPRLISGAWSTFLKTCPLLLCCTRILAWLLRMHEVRLTLLTQPILDIVWQTVMGVDSMHILGGGSPPFPSQAGTSVQYSGHDNPIKLNCKSAIQLVLLRFEVNQIRSVSVGFSHKNHDFGLGLFLGSLSKLFLQSKQLLLINKQANTPLRMRWRKWKMKLYEMKWKFETTYMSMNKLWNIVDLKCL